jgi:predicted phosphodiesterase
VARRNGQHRRDAGPTLISRRVRQCIFCSSGDLGRVREIAISTRQRLGDDRLAWISNLTMVLRHDAFALVHATPQSCWRAPSESASETDLELVYGSLARPTDVFGHSHCPFIRMFAAGTKTLINAGSVGLSYDGDPRPSYFVLDDEVPAVRTHCL